MPGRLRVLIVDDHPGIVKSLSRLLAFDCDVVGSVAGCSGLTEAVQTLKPDVVVLDMNLPGVKGLEVCRGVAQSNPQIKVIVYTAVDDPGVEQRALEAGAHAFVHKLSVDGGLLAAVRRLGSKPSP